MADQQGEDQEGSTQEPVPEGENPMRRYVANFGEQRRGVTEVILPLGSVDAIERLARDLVAFGYGAGVESLIGQQYAWYDKAKAAHRDLMENVRALADRSVPSSVVPAVDPSRSTPDVKDL